MTAESYSLREVAELLDVSRRTLHRRLQEGAFPGRFLVPSAAGAEMRIPAGDVQRALETKRRGGDPWQMKGGRELSHRPAPTVVPARELESLVPYGPNDIDSISSAPIYAHSSVLTHGDLESLRDAMLAIVREERDMFLRAVREALQSRDREIERLREEMAGMRGAMASVEEGLRGVERRLVARREDDGRQAWADILGAPNGGRESVDLDALLREVGELESMLGMADD